MSLLRRRIYSATLDDVIPQWVELMPQEGMIRFSDFRGTIVWYYEIDNGFVTLYKGWKSSLKNPLTESDVVNWVKQISDVDFYKTVDRKLS